MPKNTEEAKMWFAACDSLSKKYGFASIRKEMQLASERRELPDTGKIFANMTAEEAGQFVAWVKDFESPQRLMLMKMREL